MTKPSYERAVKKSVSMPAILLDQAVQRQRARKLTTLSDYLQTLVREDAARAEQKLAA